jgi:MFS family permease
LPNRVRVWLEHWGPIVPLLVAEASIWLGFGALLPILSIYFTTHGVDLPMLGVVVAAWPAARLLAEPFFGWLADRTSRKPLMVAGLAIAAVAAVLPLFASGTVAFIVLRALSGLCAAAYDPAARGYLVDANPPARHGEMFGLYSSAQVGGFMIGPAIGGLAAAITGEPVVVFWVAGIFVGVSALLVAFLVAPVPRRMGSAATETVEPEAAVAQPAGEPPLRSLLNGLLLAAIVFNVGNFLAGGTYEVIWSLYMTSLGADTALIGVSFFTFALPVLILSPSVGRFVDKEGGFLALVIGMFGVGLCGILYPLIPAIWWMLVMGLAEGTAAALVGPALYMLVARASPPGRSSTAQGVFGAAGTVGTIVASGSAGVLAAVDLRLPFYLTGVAVILMLGLGLLVGRRRLWLAMQPAHLDGA